MKLNKPLAANLLQALGALIIAAAGIAAVAALNGLLAVAAAGLAVFLIGALIDFTLPAKPR